MNAARTKPTPGVLVVDKPRGPTSHDVVGRVRRIFGTREVGHAGTLDPMATGVLVLALGEATKLVPYLTNAAKEYDARLVLGSETDTLDAVGRVLREETPDDELLSALACVEGLSPRVLAALEVERARTSQEPPAFSAIQRGGERAYAKARRGETFRLEERGVRVHSLTITGMGPEPAPWVTLRVKADKGYYVRSLARDLARGLGTLGHLAELRRRESGGFTLEEASALTTEPDVLRERLIPLGVAARRALPALTLSEAGERDARVGKRVCRTDLEGDAPDGEPCAWFAADGALVAIGVVGEDGRVLRGFG